MKIYVRKWSLDARICNRFKFVFHLTIFLIFLLFFFSSNPKNISACVCLCVFPLIPLGLDVCLQPKGSFTVVLNYKCFHLDSENLSENERRGKRRGEKKKNIYKQNINIQTHSTMYVTLKWKLEVTVSVYSIGATHTKNITGAKIYFRGFFEPRQFFIGKRLSSCL